MSNELIVIEALNREHEAMREQVKTVSSLLDGWEDTNWEDLEYLQPEQAHSITEKHMSLKHSMDYLDEGLKSHYSHEENEMRDLAGIPIVEAIRIEHEEILKQLEEINFFLINLNPRGFLANSPYLKLIIDNLCRLVTDHSIKEDIILELVRRRFI